MGLFRRTFDANLLSLTLNADLLRPAFEVSVLLEVCVLVET